MKSLSLTLSRKQLLAIFKTFVRSYLDYADIIYNKSFNEALKENLQKVLYSAAFIITRAIKGTSWERLYKELGLEPLCDRRCYQKSVLEISLLLEGAIKKKNKQTNKAICFSSKFEISLLIEGAIKNQFSFIKY